MSKKTELDKVILLKGTFLVDVENNEQKTESGLVVSSKQSQKIGTIVARNQLDIEGKQAEYQVGDKIVLNPNSTRPEIRLDGTKYELGERKDIYVILDRQ